MNNIDLRDASASEKIEAAIFAKSGLFQSVHQHLFPPCRGTLPSDLKPFPKPEQCQMLIFHSALFLSQTAGRGDADRPRDGLLCRALLRPEPEHLRGEGHLLHPLLLHHHAQHRPPQPQRQDQDLLRAVCETESRDQLRTRLAKRYVGGDLQEHQGGALQDTGRDL